MTQIKICGITRPEDAAHAAAAGADFLGLNFWSTSKRYVTVDRAQQLVAAARAAGPVQIAGVFVDAIADDIAHVLAHVELDVVQLHGDETPHDIAAIGLATKLPIWKALALGAPSELDRIADLAVDAILLDTPTPGRGGSGTTFDWSLARDAQRRYPDRSFVLAGGLSPDNVAQAIREVAPWAVDVASGVESAPGIKDHAKVAAFVAAVRAAR